MPLDALNYDLLELPTGWQGMRPYADTLKPHPALPLCALRVARTDARGGGIGAWNLETGRLELFRLGAFALEWLPDGAEAVLHEFAHAGAAVSQWRVEGWALLGEVVLASGMGGCNVEKIGVSESGKWLVTQRFSGQGEWGYDVLRLGPPQRAAGIDSKFGYMLELPVFAHDESRLVGGYGEHWLGGWWAHPDDDIDVPARGGRVTFGWIFEHRLPSHTVRWHELVMQIPKGFLPPDPESADWQCPGDIAPFGDGFCMTLPGGRRFEIASSPPDVIELPTPTVE